ncbi:hypothetical protein [Legionella cardiaca]|uniref:Dot/Icm T4SS effector n=1 Tax=Legionella cardiaca TaxID=1071983 RepID=A0ABY8AQ76_9GAMM|nr:hypothetical protein [Legionella cardiaca]WED42584.1 hypothetical protein PXX05_11790 [Legionella cardiaca]
MSNFISAFLAKIDLNTARDLFIQEKPDYSTLLLLIDKLATQGDYDKFAILLALLNENSATENNTQLKATILLQILMDALAHSNKVKISQTIQSLTELIDVKAQNLWQDILSRLISWIEKHNQNDDILILLQHLPLAQRERLYERLLESVDGNPPWLSPLTNYVISNRTSNGINKTLNLHFSKLASSILLSPTICDENIGYLSLTLSTEQLVSLIFQLRAIAATYVSTTTEKQHQRFIEHRQTYLSKYEALVAALTVRATSSQAEYEQLIHGNSELANILLIKRLKIQTTANQQKELINEFLKNSDKYDLHDPLFKAAITDSLLTVFKDLSKSDLSSYFKKYYSDHIHKNLIEASRFLDLFFDKCHDKTKVLRCIDDIDDSDNTVTINFITTSKAQDNELTEDCLKRLNEQQLISLCGHIMALRHLMQHDTEPLSAIYYRVLTKKIRMSPLAVQHLNDFARLIKIFPDEITEDAIKQIFANFSDNVQLRYQWLHALLIAEINKSMLLTSCQELFKALKTTEQLALLKFFTSDDLLALYLHMLRHNATEENFHCFVTLLQESDKQSLLLFMLLNTPLFNKSLLDQLLPFIDDRNLITVIEQLLEKISVNHDYKITLEQLLQHFSQRLQSTANKQAPIHQWVNCLGSSKIATYLLESPTCFQILSSRSSLFQDFTPTLLQGYLVNSAAADLKLRANRILNLLLLTPDTAENIALRLLSQFHMTPKKLQTLFMNLESAQESLDNQGKQNYASLKLACWNLLKGKSGTANSYDDKLSITFLTTQLTQAHCFDPLLAKLAINICQSEDAHLSAQYLVQIETTALEQITPQALATILTKSTQDTTKSNWQKVAYYLRDSDTSRNLILVRNVIAQVKSYHDNPVLTEQALDFILGLEQFEKLLPLLKEEELQWLVNESRPKYLIEKFPSWLQLLLAEIPFTELNYSSLLAQLPPDSSLLESIYQCPELQAHLHSIFIQLMQKTTNPAHFIALFQQLAKESNEQKRQFITHVQKLIHSQTIVPAALFVVNMLLLTLDDFRVDVITDSNLVLQHIQFITTIASQRNDDEQSNFSYELQQLMLNTFSYFIAHDNRWIRTLLDSEEFAQAALVWLKRFDTKTIDHHPFTKILLQNTFLHLHPTLTNSVSYQGFIKQLLASPPQAMKDEQFATLFDTLSAENKKVLALDLLQRPTLGDVQWSSLITLARELPIDTLYNIYTQSKTRFVFVDLLARHPMGLMALNKTERNNLLAETISGKQILRILDSYSPVITKLTFIEAIFDYLEEKNISLLCWFEMMNVDTETLAAFTNYTINEQHKSQLKQVISQNPYYSRRINNYLQNPTLDISLEPKGLLFNLLGEIASNPWQGERCQLQLQQMLEPSTMRQVVQAQFELAEQVHQLNDFYEPLSLCSEIPCQMLQSARWIQRLPLLFGGILEIINEFQTGNTEFQQIVKSTALYQQIILPLLSSKEPSILAQNQLNELYEFLIAYLQVIKNTYPKHHQRVNTHLLDYQHHLLALEHFSPPKLGQLFKPDSFFARIKKGQTRPLQEAEIVSLSTAGQSYKEWLSLKSFSPPLEVGNLLTSLLRTPKIFENSEFRKWLLEHGLFSPLARHLNSEFLKPLLGQFPNSELATQITHIHRQLQQFNLGYTTLKQLATLSSLSEITRTLYLQSLESLTLQWYACAFAHLPHLTNLLAMISQAKRAKLTLSQTQALLLPENLSSCAEVDWLHPEIAKLNSIPDELACQCQQLAISSFSANHDSQDLTRLTNFSSSFVKENIDDAALILNSYLPLLSTTQNDLLGSKFLSLLDNLYFDPQNSYRLLKKLSDSLLTKVISLALKDPATYEELLQKIIHAGFAEKCQQLIHEELNVLCPVTIADKKNSRPFLEHLSPEQFARLTPEHCEKMLTLQRLAFALNPLPELNEWHIENENKIAYGHFCADASLYTTLRQLQQQFQTSDNELKNKIQSNMEQCFHYLSLEAKLLSYHSLMENFLQNINSKAPAVYYHWLCLLSFLAEDHAILMNHFLHWLMQIDDNELAKQPFLDKLLSHILANNLTDKLCECLTQNPPLSKAKSTWLFTRIECEKTVPRDLITNLVRSFSWEWLKEQITSTTLNPLTMLENAFQHDNHVKSITENETNKLMLLNALEQKQLPVSELLDLQKTTPNNMIKSLLLAHVLGRKDYLDEIQGESFLTTLTTTATPFSQRLQPLVSQIHLEDLPPATMKQLQPEAAASLFCSVKDFHQLDESYVSPLLQTLGEQSEPFLKHWLNYYGTMPNSSTPLIALINNVPKKIIPLFAEQPVNKRHELLCILMQNLNSLNATIIKDLIPLCEEKDLVHAAHLYLYEAQSENNSIQFIKELTDKFLEKKETLTSQTIQLLMRLSEHKTFNFLREKLGRVTNDYLRSSALFADCSIFYDEGQLNVKRMQKLIPLKPETTEPGEQTSHETQQGYLQFFTKAFKKVLVTEEIEESTPIPLNDIAVNPLITIIATNAEKLQSIDYFLIHYHGKTEFLQQCLNDYLTHFANNALSDKKKLYTTTWLLTRTEVALSTRQILFDSLLNHPQLFDDKISANLLMFNTEQAINHFGLRGEYQSLITLCSLGLPLVETHSSDIKMAEQALAEAQFELSMTCITGFLAQFRIWLKRSFFYGWETWFQPRKPQYVLPFDHEKIEHSSANLILQELKTPPAHSFQVHDNSPNRENLEGLLTHTDATSSPVVLTTLANALMVYEWQKPAAEEIQTRKAADALFEGLLQRVKTDHGLATWLPKYLEPFINNRKRLIGLYVKNNQQQELANLLAVAVNGPGNFNNVAAVLSTNTPVPLPETPKLTPPATSEPSLLGKVTGTFSSISSFFWTPNKAPEEKPTVTQPVEKTGWFGGLFTR